MNYKKVILMISIIALIFTVSCKDSKKSEEEGQGKLNIYIDINDKHSLDIIKYLTDEYRNKNPKVDIKITTSLMNGGNIIEEINKGQSADLLFTSRNTMIELSRKGMLNDITKIIEKNEINHSYCDIISIYGRFRDKYYGLGLVPFTVEIFYNEEALKDAKLPSLKDTKDINTVLKYMKDNSLKVPVFLTEDLSIYDCIFSEIATTKVNRNEVEEKYDSGIESYKQIQGMQEVFKILDNMSDSGLISEDTFEVGNESSMNSFKLGNTPVLIGISYYFKMLSEPNVKIFDVYNDGMENINNPVIVNALMCYPINSKNEEQINKFTEFVFSEETQKGMEEKGFITAIKKDDVESNEIKKAITSHLKKADDSNVVLLYDFPKKLRNILSSQILNIYRGNYSDDLWEKIIRDYYK